MKLEQNYELKEKIKMSEDTAIYRAVSLKDNIPVIIKRVFAKENENNPVINIKNEFAILKSLESERILKTYGLEKEEDDYFLILENSKGVSLRQLIKENKINLDNFFTIAIDILKTLKEIHQKRVVHKDIKPDNIIIDPEFWKAQIIDFGISTKLSSQESSWSVSNRLEGSIHYIPPEQTGRINRPVDHRSDYYSLGVSFYEMLTSSLPFDSEDVMEIIHSHLAIEPKSPRFINPQIPETVSAIILQLMAKTAENRYQTDSGLLHDLEKCQQEFKATGSISNFSLGEKDISKDWRISQKLHGRESEISILQKCFDEFLNGGGETSLILIDGLAGVGKSSLANELNSIVTEKRGILFSGKYDQFNKDIPLTAIISVYTELINSILTESAEKINQWKFNLAQALGNNGKVITDLIPELEFIIGEQSALPALEPQENANRFYLTFQNFAGVFADKERPLVILLEDMQWMDSASGTLIKNIFLDSSIHYLYFAFTYRQNEINAEHPFSQLLDNLKKENFRIDPISLHPLHFDSIYLLVSESLKKKDDSTKQLSEFLFQKTEGNPFFIRELLHQLYKDSHIFFDDSTSEWSWNLEAIKRINFSGNVLDLLLNKINQINKEAQEVLKLASCIGASFDLYTLNALSNFTYKEIYKFLEEAISVDLIQLVNETSHLNIDSNFSDKEFAETAKEIIYRFQHSRIQSANYELLTGAHKNEIRKKIAQSLLGSLSEEDLEDRILEITNHFNAGIETIQDPEEKKKLLEINIRAGKKTKSAAAYSNALDYYKNAMRLLPSQSWKDDYPLTLSVHMQCAELEFLNGNFEESEKLVFTILKKAKSSLDKTYAYRLLIIQYTMKLRYSDAIDALGKALRPLGIHLPQKDFQRVIKKELALIKESLGKREVSSIITEAEVTNPEIVAAVRLLTTSMPTAYFFNPALWVVIMGKAVNLMLKNGTLQETYGYSCYGIFSGAALGDFKTGNEFGELALKISEKFNSKSDICKAINVYANLTGIWIHHLRDSERLNKIGLKTGLETGELQHAGYCAMNHSTNIFYVGRHLDSVLGESTKLFLNFEKMNSSQTVNVTWGVILNALTLGGQKSDLEDRIRNLSHEEYINLCASTSDSFSTALYRIIKAQVYYIFGQHKEALIEVQESEKLIPFLTGLHSVSQHNLYHTLTLCALYPEASEEDKITFMEKIQAGQKQLKIWADNCPENYLYMYYLAEAEFSRIKKNNWDAITFYAKAIEEADKYEFIQGKAIANEALGKFWISQKEPEIAKLYLVNAYFNYKEWGAEKKAKELKESHSGIIKERRYGGESEDRAQTVSGKRTTSQSIDLNSVLKSAAAISSEIQIEHLIEKMIKIVVENAGAQRGIFLLAEYNGLIVEAETAAGEETRTKISKSLEEFESISHSIVRYAERTKQFLVIDNAVKDERFKNDPYLIKTSAKSVFCVPVIHQDRLVGILYLENNLIEGAFTSERLNVIKTLSSQISISLENAKLYASIEDVTREKTKISTEMEIARQIQTSLLPKNLTVSGYDVVAYMKTADEVGGDYFDLIQDGDKTWFIIGDVSGHGVTAGLIMMMVQTSIHSVILSNQNISPQETLYKVNTVISDNIKLMELNKYMTLTLFLKQADTFYYSGFHQDLIIYRASENKAETIPTRGTWLGIAHHYNEFFTDSFQMNSSDSILLFTDGITEAMDKNRRMLDLNGLVDLMNKSGNLSMGKVKDRILEKMNDYKTDDDITFMLIKKV
ncbi:MAG TPA: AAA family ATPase [Leptospiraceae bacterium]|nr:AAA family ATPase [Leptospiraceae bacterium]HRG75100.1 AAA family ATPase [Leptospiraceae bacterium]